MVYAHLKNDILINFLYYQKKLTLFFNHLNNVDAWVIV
jgi:hypothetical protein